MSNAQSHRISLPELTSVTKRLPALPALTMELFASFDKEDIDVASLTRRLSNDQGLVARALRIANSPFYGLSGKVSSIHDAVIILGFQTVRSMVTSAAVVNALSSLGQSKTNSQIHWRHSIAVAVCGRHLAKVLNKNPEVAFTAGLLHGVGRMVLEAYYPAQYAAAMLWSHEQDVLLHEAEREVLGVTHTEVGALLAKQWGLPQILIEAIAYFLSPPDDLPQTLVDIIHVSNVIAIALELSGDTSETVPPLSTLAWHRLNIDWQVLPMLFHEVEKNMEETCSALLAN